MVSFYKEAFKTGNAQGDGEGEGMADQIEKEGISQAVKLADSLVLTFRGNPELN